MRPSSRDRIVEVALEVEAAAAGAEVTLEAVARAAGVTKQGLLYHFASKADLREAMLHRIIATWEEAMVTELGEPLNDVTVGRRIAAYARVAARGDVVRGETAVFASLGRRVDGLDDYAGWVERWFTVGAGPERGRLLTAWLAANSLWSVLTSGRRRLSGREVGEIVASIEELTGPVRG